MRLSDQRGSISFKKLIDRKYGVLNLAEYRERIETFITESQYEQTVQFALQQKLFIKYGASPQLQSFFNMVNTRSNQYMTNTLRAAQYYINSPNNNANVMGTLLKGLGDNCYEYAVNDIFDGNSPSDRVVDPGFTFHEDKYWMAYLDKLDANTRSNVMNMRAQMVLRFPLTNIPPNMWQAAITWDVNFFGWRLDAVAFDRNMYRHVPGTLLFAGVYGPEDYHFYRFEPEFGLWTHKRGATPVICTDESDELIFDPAQCNRGSKYPYMMGYFVLSPMNGAAANTYSSVTITTNAPTTITFR